MKIEFQAAVKYKNKIFLSHIFMNALFSYDLEIREVEYLGVFLEEGCHILHNRAFLYQNEAWFIPQAGRKIISVNLDTVQQTVYELPNLNHQEIQIVYTGAIQINEHTILAIPRDFDSFTLINMKNHKVEF